MPTIAHRRNAARARSYARQSVETAASPPSISRSYARQSVETGASPPSISRSYARQSVETGAGPPSISRSYARQSVETGASPPSISRSYARQSVETGAGRPPSGDGSYDALRYPYDALRYPYDAFRYPYDARWGIYGVLRLLAVCLLLCVTNLGFSQESSLFHQTPPAYPAPQPPLPNGSLPMAGSATMQTPQGRYQQGNYQQAPNGLAQASWTYVPPAPLRQYSVHDIVTIRVDEIARMQAEGSAENRKSSLYDVILKDWLRLTGSGVKPAPQSDGDPRVQGTMSSLYRADASIESRESLSFNIAAEIVDIRPNGNLVLEASKRIWVNENVFETSLIGTCRATDIGPDNVLLSKDLLDAEIRKDERGRLRDGYRRGWFQRWFEEFQPL